MENWDLEPNLSSSNNCEGSTKQTGDLEKNPQVTSSTCSVGRVEKGCTCHSDETGLFSLVMYKVGDVSLLAF